jgi:hypothetical protein
MLDPFDPAAMTPEARALEVATLLAMGSLRGRACRCRERCSRAIAAALR